MTVRDQELEDVSESLKEKNDTTPSVFIQKPDAVPVPQNGNCFKDQNRLCGPDCIAFGDPDAELAFDRCQILGLQAASFLQNQRLVHATELLVKLLQKKEQPGPPGPPPPPNPFGS